MRRATGQSGWVAVFGHRPLSHEIEEFWVQFRHGYRHHMMMGRCPLSEEEIEDVRVPGYEPPSEFLPSPEEALVAFEEALLTAREAGRELMDGNLEGARQLLLQGRQQFRAGWRLTGLVPPAAIREHEADDPVLDAPVRVR
jgi:hypothetical protein